MKVRKVIFGSKSERELFNVLHSHWSKQFDLCPSLPLASILDVGDESLSDGERGLVYKTSVDDTLCTKQGGPLISVEFDGMCHGFSKAGEFIQVVPSSNDPNRKRKLDLKLRLCNAVGYPLLVVSYDEKNPIGEGTTLTIVDGLIGQVLANRQFRDTLGQTLEANRGWFEPVPSHEQHEVIQELVIDAEVLAALAWNPLAKKAAQLEHEAWEKGLWKSHSVESLSDPELPISADILADPEATERFIEVIQNTQFRRMGCRMTAKTPEGDVTETAWVRNFDGYAGVSPGGLAEDIATLILAQRLLSN